MNVLVLAPQPYFQERGTPIAVDLMVRLLSARGHTVDLLVYHEGDDRAYPGVRLHRIPRLPFIRSIRPGFSLKKLVCDAFMFWSALRLARRVRPDLVHAVEEAAFIALALRRLLGIPYIYDMDSSLPDQLAEKYPVLWRWLPLLRRLLAPVAARALMIAPVCDALALGVAPAGSDRVVLLRDVSLLEDPPPPGEAARP